jgi:hypothetical protein
VAVSAGPGLEAASVRHVLSRLELVEARVRAAVARRRSTDPDPDDRFRGLYISPADVQRLLQRTPGAPPPDPQAEAAFGQVEAEADRAQSQGADLRLRRLAHNFQLDQLDLELLLIALAPDVDPRFERFYGYLQDDVSRRRASIGLSLELCGVPSTSAVARDRLAPGGSLIEGALILVEDGDRPFLTRSLRVPDRVAAHLLGSDEPDAALAGLTLDCQPAPALEGAVLGRWLEGRHRGLAYVREHSGASGASVVAAALREAGRVSLVVDLERLRGDDDVRLTGILAAREARLLDAALIATPIDALAARGTAAVRAFAELPGVVVLAGSKGWDPAWSRTVPLLLEVTGAGAAQREAQGKERLDGEAPPEFDLLSTVGQYRLTADQVWRAATAARLQASAHGRRVEPADLKAGARAQNAAGLERLARRIEPLVAFSDLVLPAEVVELLQDLVVRARQRELVLGTWRMGGASSRRRGLTALFAGPSGTGKTMAAEVLAMELGLDLYVVDLATVVDKYVGETEKNLDRIFAEAERVNGVLLFDEADALFGKRSEVRDAHDRYANVEVAYLLQRMELFDGIAVLATNLRANLDEAFARRLDSVIDFPEPEADARRQLWERCLGTRMPRGEDLDLDFLAEAFKLSGGNIRNIVVAAAYMAAESGQPVTMTNLVRATQREYAKLGRMTVESEFGPYYRLLH